MAWMACLSLPALLCLRIGQCQAYTRAAVLLTVGFTTFNLINLKQLDLGRLWVQLCGAAAASKG